MQITIDDNQLRQKISRLASMLIDTGPLMRDISRALVSESLQNFQAQGRPRWAGLSPRTLSQRRGGDGMILQDTGQLKGSIKHSWTSDVATVGAGSGASSRYAAIHQFGGRTGRGLRTVIPARPYLPITASGRLQPEAEAAVNDVVEHWLGRLTIRL